ncbi:MAG: molybdopterin synthase catalytic subunit MoaE [Pseudomonadota bacterium]
MNTWIRILDTALDPAALTAELARDTREQGALVTFIGLVRDLFDDPVEALELEHYPGMTEKALADLAARVRGRWPLGRILIAHRVGRLEPGEPIVLVGVTAAHRGEAFAACQALMDYLKTEAPLWKKEITPGGGRWVEARDSDRAAAARWQASRQTQ